ncbi:MAG: cupin domain-containing protein [Burkholderiaceae bacterium]
MALHHAGAGEVVDLAHTPPGAPEDQSIALFKTDELEVIRRVLHNGQSVPAHKVDGPVVLHCLQGAVQVMLPGAELILVAGQLSYLARLQTYALQAREHSVLLMTIVRATV